LADPLLGNLHQDKNHAGRMIAVHGEQGKERKVE
jgi:hypothetical protein